VKLQHDQQELKYNGLDTLSTKTTFPYDLSPVEEISEKNRPPAKC